MVYFVICKDCYIRVIIVAFIIIGNDLNIINFVEAKVLVKIIIELNIVIVEVNYLLNIVGIGVVKQVNELYRNFIQIFVSIYFILLNKLMDFVL